MDQEAFVHFLGGALGGTVGTAITCPLEVVKTRLQSTEYAYTALSHSHSDVMSKSRIRLPRPHIMIAHNGMKTSVNIHEKLRIFYVPQTCAVQRNVQLFAKSGLSVQQNRSLYTLFKQIVVNEGFSALFKGIGPNIVGVAPSKAVYFYTYSSSKRLLNSLDIFVSNSAMIHMFSAAISGFVTATVINPVWLVKTRLQLHKGPLSVTECIKRVWRTDGLKGFYRGVTASYVGISETVIQFVLYEEMKSLLLKWKLSREANINDLKDLANLNTNINKCDEKSPLKEDEKRLSMVEMSLTENNNHDMIDFLHFMLAGGAAKFFACSLAYPHEVVRTRMREENAVTKGFLPTLKFILRKEGFWALYRGLTVQLLRTVPNTAVTMGTYELTVHVLHSNFIIVEGFIIDQQKEGGGEQVAVERQQCIGPVASSFHNVFNENINQNLNCADELLDGSSSRLNDIRLVEKIYNYSFLEQISATENRSHVTPVALQYIPPPGSKTGAGITYDIGDSCNISRGKYSARARTVPAKQHYHNNVTTSISIPYNFNYSKQSSTVVLQNAQKGTDKLAAKVVAFKQNKHFLRGSHSFVMMQRNDYSQSTCLSQNLPLIHETLPSFHQPSPLRDDTTAPGSRLHCQNQITSANMERLPNSFQRDQQQHLTVQPSVTSKKTTVVQDLCSDDINNAINCNTIYIQQQNTAITSDPGSMYSRRLQFAATERPNTVNVYHQDLTTEPIPATTAAGNNDHSDEQHYYTTSTTNSPHQQHFIHIDYTPSSLSRQQQALMDTRNPTTLPEKLPGLQGQTCKSGPGPYVVVNQQNVGTFNYLERTFSSGMNDIDNVVPCSKDEDALVTNARQHEREHVSTVLSGSATGLSRDVDSGGKKMQRLCTNSRNIQGTLGAINPVITNQRNYLLGGTSNNNKNNSNGSGGQLDTIKMSRNYGTSSGNSYRSHQHYVPMRPSFKSSSTTERKSNRSSSKKEPMDPKNVEEEVARNVSQILSASLNQKSSSSAFASTAGGSSANMQSSSSTAGASVTSAASSKKSFTCVDCHKTVSTSRNLQRHRMSCKLAQASSNSGKLVTAGVGQLQATVISLPLNSTQTNGSNPYSANQKNMSSELTGSNSSSGTVPGTSVVSISYKNNFTTSLANTLDVLSVNNQRTTQIYNNSSELNVSDERLRPVCEDSFLDKAVAEMTRNSDLNTVNAGRLASSLLDEDDHTFSTISSPAATNAINDSHSFQPPAHVKEPVNYPTFTQFSAQIKRPGTSMQSYRCESCNKTVSSNRSLKRHRSTCKQYQLEYGQLEQKAPNMIFSTDSRSELLLSNSSVSTLPSEQEKQMLQPQSLTNTVTDSSVNNSVVTSCNIPVHPEVEVTSMESGAVRNRTSSNDVVIAGTSVGANVCEDCNRILCSASNLKRHRVTCKAASMFKIENNKPQDSLTVPVTSLSTVVKQPHRREKQYMSDQVDECKRSQLDNSFATSFSATKETVQQSVLVSATTVDTATYSNITTNEAHQRSISDASVTYIAYDTANVAPLQQKRQKINSAQPISHIESLKLGAAKVKPWITVGEHLRARHNQRIIQQRQQKRESATSYVPETVNAYEQGVTLPIANAEGTGSARLRHQLPSRSLTYGENIVDNGEQSTDQLSVKINTPRQLPYYTTRVYYDGDSGVITCGTYNQHQRQDNLKFEEMLLSPQDPSARASAPPVLTTSTTPTNCSGTTQAQLPKNEKCEARPLASIITTAPLSTSCTAADSNQSLQHQSANSAIFSTPVVCGTVQPQSLSASSTISYRCSENISSASTDSYRYECPECQKTYSCRKNVKRHRIAVHKLTPEEVAKIEPIRVLLTNDSDQKQRQLQQLRQRQMRLLPSTELKSIESLELPNEKSDMQQQGQHFSDTGNCATQSAQNVMLFQQMHVQAAEKRQQLRESQLHSQSQLQQTQFQKQQQQIISGSDHCRGGTAAVTSVKPVSSTWTSCTTPVPPQNTNVSNVYSLSEEEGIQLAEIEEGLKRSAEYRLNEADSESDNRKPVAELAEADTTFHEEYEENTGRLNLPHLSSLSSNGRVVSPPTNPSSNNSISPNYPITSPMTPQVPSVISDNGGFAAQLLPIKAPPPLSPSYSSQQMSVVQNQGVCHQSHPRISSNESQTQNPISTEGNAMFTKPVLRQYPLPVRAPLIRNYFHSLPKQKQHICVDCNRALSSDYSLKRHRSTCIEAKAAAAAKAVDTASSEADKLKDNCSNTLLEHCNDSSNSRSSFPILPNEQTLKEPQRINSSSCGAIDSGLRVSQQLTPISAKNADAILPPTYSSYDEDADNGVLCRVCDCWLPGQREFDRHCDELHPVAADPDSTTVPQTFEQTALPSGSIMLSTAISSEVSLNPSGSYSVATAGRKRVSSDPLESGSYYSSKNGKHLCQTCGKYYSSEWNLERHRRESCPLQMKRLKTIADEKTRLAKLEPVDMLQFQTTLSTRLVDDCALIVGESRIGVPRAMLSRASTYFSSLFQYYENHSDVPLPVPVDPIAFHQSMEAFKGRLQLDGKNIDCILFMADKFKIKPLYDRCERFIAEKLPSSSVMHAIRLAEQYRMCEIKQALFDSISIDVFRSLAADEDYRQMGAELKAELLEKWGTFL